MTSPRIRTSVHCLAGVVVTIGVMIPVLLSTLGLHWRTMCGVMTLVPVLGLAHLSTVPESPHWLVMRGRLRSALKSLIKLRGLDYDCVREREMLGEMGKA